MHQINAAKAAPPGPSVAPRRWAASALVVLAATVGAVGGAHAQGMPGSGDPGSGGTRMNGPEKNRPGLGGHEMFGPGPMMFGGPPERVARTVDHLLDGLNATDQQRSQIKQIAIGAATDLRAMAERDRSAHDRGVQIFAAPTVDASAAESLRQELLAQHEQASRRVLQAMLDVAKVLTPEQRAKIADRLHQREAILHDRMRREHRERPPK